MQFIRTISIERYFDVSVIIPVHGDGALFSQVFLLNRSYLQRNGIEVIVVLAGPDDERELSGFWEEHPCINWKVIRCTPGGEYSRGRAVNEGIRLADNKYILVLEPATEFVMDLLYPMRYMLHHYPDTFATAPLLPVDAVGGGHASFVLIAEKEMILATGGYIESATAPQSWKYGMICGAQENLRARLELAGKRQMKVPQVMAVCGRDIHPEAARTWAADEPGIAACEREILYPKNVVVNERHAAMGGGTASAAVAPAICYDWKRNKGAGYREGLLSGFEASWTPTPDIYEKMFPLICLIQVRNEIRHIPAVLQHLDAHCDGIILLDDGSEDGSYEQAFSSKLILKVKKRYDGYFDDLGNRNLLLQLAHLFNADWFYFMDADERFDGRFTDLRKLTVDDRFDTVLFRVVHLWNDERCYRTDVPASENGVLWRYRMFRNKGFTQILSERKLYFAATPFMHRVNQVDLQTLVLHYGLMDAETRQRKYALYSAEDRGGGQQGHGYEYLIDTEPALLDVSAIGQA